MAKRKQRVTLNDVAREAGVSAMTVSRVINHKGRISEDTRTRVFNIIDKLGYRPNRAAQTLVTNKTFMIAFVVPDITNPYFSQLFQGMDDVLHEENYNILVVNSNENAAREKVLLENLDDSLIDGLVICSSRLSDDELFPLLSRFSAVVAVTRPVPRDLASLVRSDYVPGYRAILAFQYLHKLGYRKIGYLPLQHYSLYVNEQNFAAQLEEIGVRLKPEWVMNCAPKWRAGYNVGYQLLESHPEIEAVVGGNDLVALGTMRAAIDLGRVIPDDLGLVGADDILLASQVSPPLTTLRTNSYEIGQMAADLLLKRVNGDFTYREYKYNTEIVVRGSTRPEP